jgi:hypothetical protein
MNRPPDSNPRCFGMLAATCWGRRQRHTAAALCSAELTVSDLAGAIRRYQLAQAGKAIAVE